MDTIDKLSKDKFLDDRELMPMDISIKENINSLWCRQIYNVEKIHEHTKGEGINVAVIDTGEPSHKDLIIRKTVNLTNNSDSDVTGHSTHVSGIIAGQDEKIYGIAPDSNLFIIKALDDSGISSFEIILKALVWCLENEIHVINMSLGSAKKPSNDEEYRDIIAKLVDKGVVMCSAAGNVPGVKANYPAEYENVISVASVSKRKKLEDWCNSTCDFAAPSSAYSCYLDNTYARLRGTSQATAFLSGTVSCIKSYFQKPWMNYEEIYSILQNISVDIELCQNGMPQPNLLVEGEKYDSIE